METLASQICNDFPEPGPLFLQRWISAYTKKERPHLLGAASLMALLHNAPI